MAFAKTWNNDFHIKPTGADLVGQVDNFIVETRQAIEERLKLEHRFDLLINGEQGSHRIGSARVWYSDTEPASPVPKNDDGGSSADLNIGRIWVVTDDTYAPTGVIKIHNGTEWKTIGSFEATALLSALKTVDGTGSGLDADLLDGKHLAQITPDDLAEGTTYKRILAAVATALNGGTYKAADATTADDADKVSGYGVGVVTPATITSSALDAGPAGGFYRVDNPTGLASGAHNVLVLPLSIFYQKQIASPYDGEAFYQRNIENGTPGSWYQIWNSATDGAGSGLDADLLDGESSAHYHDAAQLTGTISLDRIPTELTGKNAPTATLAVTANHVPTSQPDSVNGAIWVV